MITLFILSLLVVTIVGWWTVSRRRHRTTRSRFDNHIPLLALPAVPGQIARPTHGAAERRFRSGPASVPTGGSRRYEPVSDNPVSNTVGRQIRTRDSDVSTLSRPARAVSADNLDDDAGAPVDGASVRYWRAADGTLQFLPGRLELAAGHDVGHEIRFVRTAGPDGTTVTFGRAEGAPYRHVQLREPTVSRSHARMTLEPALGDSAGGHAAQWRLENLSATNPVVVNGRPLAGDAGPRSSVILSDGDRIEMGEVAFIFRAR